MSNALRKLRRSISKAKGEFKGVKKMRRYLRKLQIKEMRSINKS